MLRPSLDGGSGQPLVSGWRRGDIRGYALERREIKERAFQA